MILYYWCPFIDYVATIKAVLNSSLAINKYSKKKNHSVILNSIGEWDQYSNFLEKNKIKQIRLTKNKSIYKNLPRNSYLKSRLSYIIISFFTFINLIKFLNKRTKNDLVILHLVTSMPLILLNLFNFKCKFVLRISGYPKLNILRKLLWKISNKNLLKVFVPTIETREKLIKHKVFEKNKLLVIRDPIIDIKEINQKKKKLNDIKGKEKTLISIGRLTNQKNHRFLIECFSKILKSNKDLKLKILGKGELKKDLENLINQKGLNDNVELVGHVGNIYEYLKDSFCFILTSKWEDPGFVIVESAAAKTTILTSDCESGPKEFIEKTEKCGYLYKEGDRESFIKKFHEMYQDSLNKHELIKNKKFYAFKKIKMYGKYHHFKQLNAFLNNLNN
jgi:glycosyltransferase involved in cell wall biosynthesis